MLRASFLRIFDEPKSCNYDSIVRKSVDPLEKQQRNLPRREGKSSNFSECAATSFIGEDPLLTPSIPAIVVR